MLPREVGSHHRDDETAQDESQEACTLLPSDTSVQRTALSTKREPIYTSTLAIKINNSEPELCCLQFSYPTFIRSNHKQDNAYQ
jgi:hypothetical protein